jgi:hypothetical protein
MPGAGKPRLRLLHNVHQPAKREQEATMSATTAQKYDRFADFYPFYLSEHANRSCRRLHFLGSSLALACFALAIASANWWWMPAALVCGYGCAWIGHFGFEKNKPASFRQPLYSFMGDCVMYAQIWSGKVKI